MWDHIGARAGHVLACDFEPMPQTSEHRTERALRWCPPLFRTHAARFLGPQVQIIGLLDRTLRVGHMGVTASAQYVLPTVIALESALAAHGHRFTRGEGLRAAQEVFEKG